MHGVSRRSSCLGDDMSHYYFIYTRSGLSKYVKWACVSGHDVHFSSSSLQDVFYDNYYTTDMNQESTATVQKFICAKKKPRRRISENDLSKRT